MERSLIIAGMIMTLCATVLSFSNNVFAEAINADKLESIIKTMGIEVSKNKNDKEINRDSLSLELNGYKVLLLPRNCIQDKCSTLMMVTMFNDVSNMTLEKINRWNNNKFYIKASMDEKDRSIYFEEDLRVYDVIDSNTIRAWIRNYRNAMPDMAEFLRQ